MLGSFFFPNVCGSGPRATIPTAIQCVLVPPNETKQRRVCVFHQSTTPPLHFLAISWCGGLWSLGVLLQGQGPPNQGAKPICLRRDAKFSGFHFWVVCGVGKRRLCSQCALLLFSCFLLFVNKNGILKRASEAGLMRIRVVSKRFGYGVWATLVSAKGFVQVCVAFGNLNCRWFSQAHRK